MKNWFFIALIWSVSSLSYAAGISDDCAALQVQLEQMDAQTREMFKSGPMKDVIDMCAKEDTSAAKQKMQSGTLYCASGDLCASYDFTHASDRALYAKSCSQRASCPGDYKDKCTVRNDKVKNGVGMVDWTIYSYSGEMPAEAKSKHCM